MLLSALAAALLLAAAPAAQARKPAELQGRAERVVDGDTLWIAPRDGGRALKVRLQGLDAPELCQAWGPQSRAALQALVRRRELHVRVAARDGYGRLVARLFDAQGQDLGERLVREGAAWNDGWRRRPGPYAQAERAARALGLGLHADAAALHPREFRRRHGPCEPR
ncbi:thermonuclease family protein [Azohydromonas sp. G-1-1-14]|uniref:Thermonuclease family protein n=2 Tax=Azohydromonas caseinilytica TaxID=2728836 RepID=A0A848FE65_9BURK|nr:thermonuclease family protein [Azohydromonas caseinilytica]